MVAARGALSICVRPLAGDTMRLVFLSYARSDKSRVDEIFRVLKKARMKA